MVEPVNGHPELDGPEIAHPATDTVTAKAVVIEQNRAVVGLSTWIADAAVDAVIGGRTVQVVTPADSLLTYPLEVMLGQAHGQWVVRAPDRFRNGLTGRPLHWDGTSFAPAAGASGPDLTPAAVAWSGGIELQIVTPHRATEDLELGATAEIAMRALTGRKPAGWGIAEPATDPWSRRELTAFCRNRAPAATSLVIVGGEPWAAVLGVLTVERVGASVREQLRIAGPPLKALAEETVESLVESLVDELAGSVRSVIVAVHPGRSGGLRSSTPTLPALPYGVLVGAEEAAGEPLATGIRARAIGGGTKQAWWYRLDDGPGAPYEALTAVLKRYGFDTV